MGHYVLPSLVLISEKMGRSKYPSNPTLKRDCAKARSPLAPRYALGRRLARADFPPMRRRQK